MRAYPLRAVVLRKTKLGEADLIITLLARDGRQVRAVAKGARKPKSRLGGRVEPFTVLDLLLHSGRTLEVVSEAETVASHDGLRTDIDRAAAAAVVADLLDKISVEGQTEPALFEMTQVTLGSMESATAEDLRVLLLAFLVKALSMHGYRPALDACAACGGGDLTDCRFSAAAGGVLCARCVGEDPGAARISASALRAMRALLGARLAEVGSLGIPADVADEVLSLMAGYVAYHVPARLRALESYLRDAAV